MQKQPPSTLVDIRVQPKASRNALVLEPDGHIRVTLTAPPVEGAANAALREFVAGVLGIARSSVAVVKGERSRNKTLRITGLDIARVNAGFSDYVIRMEKRTK